MGKTKKILAILLMVMLFMAILTVNAKATVSTSVVFDAEFYLNSYADLRAAYGNDYEAAYNHYLTYGIKEGRQASPVFDVRYYISQYEDLQAAYGDDYESAYNHFLVYGIKEGRRSSYEFDVKYYISQYEDLQVAFGDDYESAYNHVVAYGMSEGRVTSADFNVRCYINGYEDLKAAFETNWTEGFTHYYLFGANEGRHTTHNVITTEAVEATCTETGLTEGSYCEYCEEVFAEAEEVAALGHDMTKVEAVEATCTEDGTVEYYVCANEEGVYYVDEEGSATYTEEELVVPATDHTWGEIEILEEATCTSEGSSSKTCTVCGATLIETIEKEAHDMTKVEAVDAKCTEDGTVEYYVCANEEGVYYVDEEGSATYTEEELVVASTGHSVVEVADEDRTSTAATCTTDGYDETVCENCGKIFLTSVEAYGHDYSTFVSSSATCDSPGVEIWQCSRCDATIEIDVDATHTISEWTSVDATCTTQGYKIGICDVCGEVVEETIDMIDHTWDDGVVTVDSTCTENGYMTYTCTVCGETSLGVISYTGHGDPEYHEAVAATCTEDGNEAYYSCPNESGVYYADAEFTTELDEEDVIITATGHSWDAGEVTTAATCTETGVMTYTCTVCGETYTEEIEATGHDMTKVDAVETTCTSDGSVEYYVCANEEGVYYVDEEGSATYTEEELVVAATGHTWDAGEVTTAATCTEAGEMTYTCTVCSETYTEEIEATGEHSYTVSVDVTTLGDYTEATCTEAGYEAYACDMCGDIEIKEVAALEHDYVGVVTTEATCEENGVMTYTCSRCQDSYTVTIIATGHTYPDEVSVSEEYTSDVNGVYSALYYKTCTVCGDDTIYYLDSEGTEEVTVIEVTSEAELISAISTINSDSETSYVILITSDITTSDKIDVSSVTIFVNVDASFVNEVASSED